jgi:hypothetical protein
MGPNPRWTGYDSGLANAVAEARLRAVGKPGSEEPAVGSAETLATEAAVPSPLLAARDAKLRAEYVACSYLVSACEEALDRVRTLSVDGSRCADVPTRAIAIMD